MKFLPSAPATIICSTQSSTDCAAGCCCSCASHISHFFLLLLFSFFFRFAVVFAGAKRKTKIKHTHTQTHAHESKAKRPKLSAIELNFRCAISLFLFPPFRFLYSEFSFALHSVQSVDRGRVVVIVVFGAGFLGNSRILLFLSLWHKQKFQTRTNWKHSLSINSNWIGCIFNWIHFFSSFARHVIYITMLNKICIFVYVCVCIFSFASAKTSETFIWCSNLSHIVYGFVVAAAVFCIRTDLFQANFNCQTNENLYSVYKTDL